MGELLAGYTISSAKWANKNRWG